MKQSKPEIMARRAELIAELFLQDLNADYVAQPTQGVGYDFLAGFANTKHGTNNYLVEVKSTERPVTSKFPVQRKSYERLAHSNTPALLLVVDVKQNRLYYGWIRPHETKESKADQVMVPVTAVDETIKNQLRKQLTS